MAIETVTLRPATAADAESLAGLVLQLYHAEAPQMLRAPREGQLQLFRHLSEYELAGGARGRFLAVDAMGHLLGSVSLRFASDAMYATMPPGLLSLAIRLIGPLDTMRLLASVLRASLASEVALRSGECYVYSVVVDEAARGRGIGQTMMEQVEGYARRAGAHTTLLRVLTSNQRARRLYERLGYRVVARTPALLRWLGLPSDLMRKQL